MKAKLFTKPRRWILIASFTSLLICLFIYLFASANKGIEKEVQTRFLQLESIAETEADELLKEYRQKESIHTTTVGGVYKHVYDKDSLVYWNSNKMPVPRLASLKFPGHGLIHLKNGWYYSVLRKKGDQLAVVSFLVKQHYSYENEYLTNKTSPDISEYNFDLSLDEQEGTKIFNKAKQYCFSFLEIKKEKKTSNGYQVLFGAIALFFLLWYVLTFKKALYKSVGVALWLLFLYVLSISEVIDSDILSPRLFAYNTWIPNLFTMGVVIAMLAFVMLGFTKTKVITEKKGRFWKPVLLLLAWWIVEGIIPFVLNNSSIPIGLNNLFELKPYSYGLIALFVLLFLSYNVLFRTIFNSLLKDSKGKAVMLLFLFCIVFILLEIFILDGSEMSIALPLALTITHLVFLNKRSFRQRLLRAVFSTIILSSALVSQLTVYNVKKDIETRAVLARKIISERDVQLELNYTSLSNKIKNADYFYKIIQGKQENLTPSKFTNVLENKFFNGFWEGYEISFNLFDSLQNEVIISENTDFNGWESLIESAGRQSEIDSRVYFIPSSINSINYIIKQSLENDKHKTGYGTLFISLKSKLIPEEIGFPRLLISNKANTLDYLKKYSIAKYKKRKLRKSFGSYGYPVYLSSYSNKTNNPYSFDGQSHYLLEGPYESAVVLSMKKPEGLAVFTPYAYVFCLMGIVRLLFLLFTSRINRETTQTISLAFKIQAILVSMVVLSLFLFGAGSGLFVRNQYTNYNNRVINEKLESVSEELKNKVSKIEKFDITKNGTLLEKTLSKLSRVFLTDINIYDADGFLVSTSRQKVFTMGLLSEQINPAAFESLKKREKNQFAQKENIGKLVYTSSYKPIYNKLGNTIGYINLQHFGQQEDYENQIQAFLVAIINVFMFLLALSIILSLVISNWLTRPLQILQESLSKLKLGSKNEKIKYTAKDEIGLIVNAYNEKIEELEAAAEKLTRTERETAWREMAKQVAHEIKNPLTPMKLSVQQLLRAYDPENPEKSKEQIKKVVDSVIEQIDGLTRIANEFSNFAQMPQPKKEKQDLVALIENTLVVYENREDYVIETITEEKEISVNIDKSQIIQVLNNLIKNAIQSLHNTKKGEIKIDITLKNVKNQVSVTISDNGTGISEVDQEKIFIPHFTTKSKGSGIGLSLVKQIIENHGGKIWFSSEEGKGSSFSFSVPIN